MSKGSSVIRLSEEVMHSDREEAWCAKSANDKTGSLGAIDKGTILL